MQVVIALRTLALGSLLIGCEDPAARVALVPVQVGDRDCGRPAEANQLAITAFAQSGEVKRAIGVGQPIDLADFPEDTVQLGVEVVIGGGEVGAAGKTAPLGFADLEDGATIPIMMVPPGGFCPVGPLGEARKTPLVARAGDNVLVVGGIGPAGPLTSAELYDADTGTFVPIFVPEALRDDVDGLSGYVLTTLPDGNVVLSGGARGLVAVFDAVERTFTDSTDALGTRRAFHGAVASPRGLLVAGGCQGVMNQTCNATPLRSIVEIGRDGVAIEAGPNLAPDAIVEGAQLFDTGGIYVLAGGFGTPGEGHRFAFGDRDAVKLTGLAAQPVMLDGGAVLTAFAADGAPAAGPVVVVTPSGGVAAIGNGPLLAGARLVTLEDGRVLAIGGPTDAAGVEVARVADYDPMTDVWELRVPTQTQRDPAQPAAVGDQPGLLDAPSLVRLADGSVLVLGGETAPSTNAWVYRPSLIGPASGSVTAVPTSPDSPGVLTPSDPTTVTRADWVLASPDDTLAARALLGGPRMRRGSIKVTATVLAGGLALIAQQVAFDRALVAHLVSGEPVRLEQLGTGTVCTGDPITLPAGAITVTLEVGDGVAVRLGDETVLACDHVAVETGAWGVAASGTGARVAVATVTGAR